MKKVLKEFHFEEMLKFRAIERKFGQEKVCFLKIKKI